MKFKLKYIFRILPVLGILIFAGFNTIQPEKPETGFWAMKGNLVTHIFEDNTDSLSGPEIFELQDENGLPVWFGRHIFKDVCMSGECKMIRLWLFWDGSGNFLGMQVYDNEPLTKSDHSEFKADDYLKLESILKDTASVLKELNSEDLIIVPDSINPYEAYEVDGYTAATQPALTDVVVKDAVYTCHTLWHTVYGPVQNAIQDIHENRLNTKHLSLWFKSSNPQYNLWAIRMVKKFPEFHTDHYPKIVTFIKSENPDIAIQALNYFQPSHLQNKQLQIQMAELIPEISTQQKYDILWKFIALKEVDEEIVLKLLHYFHEDKLGVGALNLICRIITEEHLDNTKIAKMVTDLSAHENNYVRNVTLKLLNKNPALNQMN
jgi:hypothetical protein